MPLEEPAAEELFEAYVDGQGYATLAAAIDEVEEGGTVKLEKDAYVSAFHRTTGKSFTLDLNGGTVEGNGAGSVFHFTGGTVVLKDGTITGGGKTEVDGKNVGGNLCAENTDLTLKNCVVTANAESGKVKNGGGIYAKGGKLTLDGCEIRENLCEGQGSYGGAVYAENCAVTIRDSKLTENSTWTSNQIVYGALYMKGGTLDADSVTVSGNASSRTDGFYLDGVSGVIVNGTFAGERNAMYAKTAEGGTLQLEQCKFNDRTAQEEVLLVTGKGSFAADGCQFNGNTMTGKGSISKDTKSKVGGVIGVNSTGATSFTNCEISGNAVTANTTCGKAAVVITKAAGGVTMTDCRVTGNSGGAYAAGIYAGGPLTLERCEISENRMENAGNVGGGLYVANAVTAADTLIKNNEVVQKSGFWNQAAGGVAVPNGSFTMTGGALYGNRVEGSSKANDLYTAGTVDVTLPEAEDMKDGEQSFAGFSWADLATLGNSNMTSGKQTRNYTVMRLAMNAILNTATNQTYNDLKTAMEKAKSGHTLKVTAEPGSVIYDGIQYAEFRLNKNLTIDLNGCQLYAGGQRLGVYRNLTLLDGGSVQTQVDIASNGALVLGDHVTLEKKVTMSAANFSRPGAILVNGRLESLAAQLKNGRLTVAEGGSVEQLTVSTAAGKAETVVKGPVQELVLSLGSSQDSDASTAVLNSAIGTLTLSHHNRFAATVAGENFRAERMVLRPYLGTWQETPEGETLGHAHSDYNSAITSFEQVMIQGPVSAGSVDLENAAADWGSYEMKVPFLTTVGLKDGNVILHKRALEAILLTGDASSLEGVEGLYVATSLEELKAALAESGYETVYSMGTIELDSEQAWTAEELGSENVVIHRWSDFTGEPMFRVTRRGEMTLAGITLDGKARFPGSAPLVEVAGGALYIRDGAVLKNNRNTGLTGGEGGAVLAESGTVEMTGGEICGNTAFVGGGLAVMDGAEFTLSGGSITDNTAFGTRKNGAVKNSASGGGVLVADDGRMVMDGGEITGNHAIAGGGVALGSLDSSYYVNGRPEFEMTGGEIRGNTSDKVGGGLFVQNNGVATITGGTFSGNASEGGAFGGGAIYVNGGKMAAEGEQETVNGELHLTNVYISGNTAGKGGGLAACPTSVVKIHLKNGGILWNNENEDGDRDDIYMVKHLTGYIPDPSNEPFVHISRNMLGGGQYQWTKVADGSVAPSSYLNSGSAHVYAAAETTTAGPEDCDVIITGNRAATAGGAIGTNGNVYIGEEDPQHQLETTNIIVEKDWEYRFGESAQAFAQQLREIKVLLWSKSGDGAWTVEDSAVLHADLNSDGTESDCTWLPVEFRNLVVRDEDGTEYSYQVAEEADDRFDQTDVEREDGDPIVYTFTNTPDYSLKVEKRVVNTYETDAAPSFRFTITLMKGETPVTGADGITAVDQNGGSVELTFDEQGRTTVALSDGEYVLLKGLTPEMTYSVTEERHPDYQTSAEISTWTTASAKTTEKVAADQVQDRPVCLGENHVVFVNRTRDPMGGLAISKTVTRGDTQREWHFTVTFTAPDGTPLRPAVGKPAFSFRYVKTLADGTSKTGTVTVDQQGRALFTDEQGQTQAEIALAHGQSVTIDGVPAGTLYAVRELEANQDGYTTNPADGLFTGAIANKTVARADYENRRSGGGSDPDPKPDPRPDPDPDPGVDIPDPDVPLGELPDEPTDLEDPDVPLTDLPVEGVPKTGDPVLLWAAAGLLSGAGLTALSVTGRKKDGEE